MFINVFASYWTYPINHTLQIVLVFQNILSYMPDCNNLTYEALQW